MNDKEFAKISAKKHNSILDIPNGNTNNTLDDIRRSI